MGKRNCAEAGIGAFTQTVGALKRVKTFLAEEYLSWRPFLKPQTNTDQGSSEGGHRCEVISDFQELVSSASCLIDREFAEILLRCETSKWYYKKHWQIDSNSHICGSKNELDKAEISELLSNFLENTGKYVPLCNRYFFIASITICDKLIMQTIGDNYENNDFQIHDTSNC